MKLDPESCLSLNDLKGAFVYKETKEGKEETYRIYDFSISFDPCYDNPQREYEITGYELDEIMVTLIPIENGKLNKEKKTGKLLDDLKSYTIQFSGGFMDKDGL